MIDVVNDEPRNMDVQEWRPIIKKLRTIRADTNVASTPLVLAMVEFVRAFAGAPLESERRGVWPQPDMDRIVLRARDLVARYDAATAPAPGS